MFCPQFDEFYEEIFEELKNYGSIEDIQVCENLGEHMVGNVYVKFEDEEDAQEALLKLHGRFYAGKTLVVEFSPFLPLFAKIYYPALSALGDRDPVQKAYFFLKRKSYYWGFKIIHLI